MLLTAHDYHNFNRIFFLLFTVNRFYNIKNIFTRATGKACTDRITQCLPGQCLNGGACVLDAGISQCHCAVGWGGPFCAEPVDQCQGQPCHNGGTCESGPGWFRCLCAKGFSGPDCRINVNECSPQPCLGGATCMDGIGEFTCICPSERRGVKCEICKLFSSHNWWFHVILIFFFSATVLSNPASACLNVSTLLPYTALVDDTANKNNTNASDETTCNSCVCLNGKPKCTNIWCGLSNCLRGGNSTPSCDLHEVCVPTLQEACLSPPCLPRGDCRALEPSRRVAPPKLPTTTDCWPNQAELSAHCARITILLESKRVAVGTSVEGVCLNLRILLGTRLVKTSKEFLPPLLVVLCDMKSGSNDSIEVTVVSWHLFKIPANIVRYTKCLNL